ncbi:MAG: GTP-binding protein [Firmicutes bacterium]|nr:GTP-binding protein [Bacillota bacterium]
MQPQELSTESRVPQPEPLPTVHCPLSTTEDMNIVIAGHVDHGKSTIIGRLLADTHSLPEGKLDQVQENCRRNSKPFEYAFLLDALKDERAQGITIDSARCFFKTARRNYIIIDAPGHIEFLKNMVTGASQAEAALLVIDATEGIQENSRRHGYMLSLLGIKQIAVLVNKMDLVGYDPKVFENIKEEYQRFLSQIEITPHTFIPVSGMQGDNVAGKSSKMPWYQGLNVLEVLDNFKCAPALEDKPFRMPVQGVYKFTKNNDTRRIIAGTVESGRVSVGDEVIFYPSGKKTTVASIEAFHREAGASVSAGWATGFTLKEQIYITRGELAARSGEPKPQVTSRLKVNLFWLGKEPAVMGKNYYLKIGAAKVEMQIEEIIRVIDASTLNVAKKEMVGRHDVAECILKLEKTIAFDLAAENVHTSRFVIVDNYEIAGGGIILEGLPDAQTWIRDNVFLRNYKWETSRITGEERAERYNQRASLIVITGQRDVGKKPVAKALERMLFDLGKIVYFLGIGNILYGVDADIKTKLSGNPPNNREHVRRLAEVANIILDAGMILIVTATQLTREDMEIIKATANPKNTLTVWVGKGVTTDIAYDLYLPEFESEEQAAAKIKIYLQEQGIIFRP